MITTNVDYETISLTQFTHPEHGVLRIIGDYDANPGVTGSTEPSYKCQQIKEPKDYFMFSKTLVKGLLKNKK